MTPHKWKHCPAGTQALVGALKAFTDSLHGLLVFSAMQTEISQRGPITCVSVVLERRSDACIETGSGSICERARGFRQT